MAAHCCPVCGFAALEEPPADITGEPTYAICPSCGTQFGADDLLVSHDALRDAWVEGGMTWWSEAKAAPAGWDPRAQLTAAGFAPGQKPDG